MEFGTWGITMVRYHTWERGVVLVKWMCSTTGPKGKKGVVQGTGDGPSWVGYLGIVCSTGTWELCVVSGNWMWRLGT